jgi:transcription elongation factor GreB
LPVYLTPAGARALQEELRRLLEVERPKTVQEVSDAAAQGDRSENAEYIYGKKRLREIDRRVRSLQKRLDAAVVVQPAQSATDTVRFGATVVVEDEAGSRRSYRIVGPDEANPAGGSLSYQSPVGAALLKKKVGDSVVVRRPAGEIELVIVAVSYETV